VPITENGIATSEFIEATEGVVQLFDLLGNSAFVVVQNDMNGNIKVCFEKFSYISRKFVSAFCPQDLTSPARCKTSSRMKARQAKRSAQLQRGFCGCFGMSLMRLY